MIIQHSRQAAFAYRHDETQPCAPSGNAQRTRGTMSPANKRLLDRAIRFVASASLAIPASHAYAAGAASENPVEAIIACIQMAHEEKTRCLNELPSRLDTPLTRVMRGHENLYPNGRAQAVIDFEWALAKGYPLAIGAMSVLNRQPPDAFREWILKSADAGMADGASYYMRRAAVGSTLKQSEELTFLAMIGCHPASLKETNLLYMMRDYGVRNKLTIPADIVKQFRASEAAFANEQMSRFNESCWNNTYYFRYDLPKADIAAGLERARARTRKAIEGIKANLKVFPELYYFTRDNLLYTPDSK